MLANLTINDFTAALASPAPAPGGGSAAALAGLLGVSLLEMAINLTCGRQEFAAVENVMAEKRGAASCLRAALLDLVDRDADAFKAVVAAQTLPQASVADRQARDTAIAAAIKEAAEVPLRTAGACLAVLELTDALLDKVNPHVVSDLGVGALASHTGLVGALYSTAINLPLLKDAHLASGFAARAKELRGAGDHLMAAIRARIDKEPTFAVLRT